MMTASFSSALPADSSSGFETQSGEAGLSLDCPVMLAPSGQGTVSVSITNSLDQEILPVITVDISRGRGTQTSSQALSLAAVVTLGSLAALRRWWGPSLFLDAFALITLGVILTRLDLFPGPAGK
jgi:hypothetical protein